MKIRVVLLVILFCFMIVAPAHAQQEQEELVKAMVLEVGEAPATTGSFGEMANQRVVVRILDGDYQGEIVEINNMLTGHPYYDLMVNPGDRVLIQVDTSFGEPVFHLTDFARDRVLTVLFLAFVLALALIGGVKGVKALMSLAVMALAVVYILLPLILSGFNPVLATVSISSGLTVVFLLFVGGINKKTFSAIVGTIGGLTLAGVLAVWVGRATYLTGLSSSEAQMLQFLDGTIDFQGLLFAGIMLGALGAILDVGMSVSSAMEQIKEVDPKIELRLLITRGLNVGRDMLGTMANTLILAYLGTSLPLLLLFQAHQAPLLKIINLDLIATELVRAMAGTIGLAMAIPLTAVIAGWSQTHSEVVANRKKSEGKTQ